MRMTIKNAAGIHDVAMKVYDDSAIISTKSQNALAIGQVINVNDTNWRVLSSTASLYLPGVINYTLIKENT